MKLSTFMTMLCVGTNVQLTAAQAQIVRRKIETVQKGHDALDKTLTARLQRTGEIEQILFDMANGKLPLPSQQDCRVLAIRLGTPKAEWSEQVKEHKWEGETERDALVAQVEALKLAYKNLCGAINDMDDCEEGSDEMAFATVNVFAVMKRGYEVANEPPQQHLAEIRAQAGRAGFVAGSEQTAQFITGEIGYMLPLLEARASQYADSIRRGEVK